MEQVRLCVKQSDAVHRSDGSNCQAGDETCQKDAQAFEAARQQNLQSKDDAVQNAALAYGDVGVENGVMVQFGDPGEGNDGTTTPQLQGNADGTMGVTATIVMRSGLRGTDLTAAVGHEGTHLMNAQAFAASFTKNAASWDLTKNLTGFQTEFNAFRVTHSIFASANQVYNAGCAGCTLGRDRKTPADVDLAIKRILANPTGPYGFTPSNQGARQFDWP